MIVVNLILGLLGIVAFGWLMVGGVIGMVWLILFLVNSDKKKVFNWKKWLIVTLGGLGLMGVVFCLYALIFILVAVFGLDTGMGSV